MNWTVDATSEKAQQKPLTAIVLTVLPLALGGIASLLTADAMMQFGELTKPPLSPPGWLFPVAWTILYLLMGMASYLIYRVVPLDDTVRRLRRDGLLTYGLQLALNVSWSIVFFGLGMRWPAFGILMVMWILVITCTVIAFRLDRTAGLLLVPYVAWTTFAAYLNAATALLN